MSGKRMYQPNNDSEPIEGVFKTRKPIKNKIKKQANWIAPCLGV